MSKSSSMTPATIRAIRNTKGWSQTRLAQVLRIKDLRTIQRWERGAVPVSGPASIVLEMIASGDYATTT